jgi:hypothetical protein
VSLFRREEDDAAKRERDLRERRQFDLKFLMSTPKGRRIMWSFIDDDRLSYAGENTHDTAFAEGVRSVRLSLKIELQNAASEEYVLMMQEALADRIVSSVPKPDAPVVQR